MAVELALASGTLSPLPGNLRIGLMAITVFGALSLISAGFLFFYIGYRLANWRPKPSQPRPDTSNGHAGAPDLSLGLVQRQYDHAGSDCQAQHRTMAIAKTHQSNPFLFLIHSLLAADMIQALAFLLNVEWIASDGIIVPTATCWAQGWILSIGLCSSSIFLSLIAANTYATVMWGFAISRRAVLIVVFSAWGATNLIVGSGPAVTNNGVDAGGYFVRANAWCWINAEYGSTRLWCEYFWVILSIAFTIIVYTIMFVLLHLKGQSMRHLPRTSPCKNAPQVPSGHHPAFLVYPILYLACTAPIAFGRILAMAGYELNLNYFCCAGAFLAIKGLLDTILWVATIMLSSSQSREETGLKAFDFMRTPHNRRFGNMVWVEGATRRPDDDMNLSESRRLRGRSVWWSFGKGVNWVGRAQDKSRRPTAWIGLNNSQESLRSRGAAMNGNVIQMDVVTSVTVDIVDSGKRDTTPHSADSEE